MVKEEKSLANKFPELVKEWHPTKNGDIKPTEVSYGAGMKVWWQCSIGHEWLATPNKRTSDGTGCPYCSNKKVLCGFNDLATTNPRLAKEWHPTKNGDLTPFDITEGSLKKVWWICDRGHEWQASLSNRSRNRNCALCLKELKTSFPEQAIYFYIKQYFSDAENANNTAIMMELDVYVPSIQVAVEYDGVYYHKSAGNKKREEKKNKACADANIQLIRVREKGLDSYSDCVCITDIDSADMMMLNNAIVEILSLMGISKPDVDIQKDMQRILSTYLVSEHRRNLLLERPDLAAEWHPTKNGNVKPENLAYSSGKKVWWKCE